ncbi:hypothetical protein VFMJ11_B0086 (plasmid) [Aliivibrio fischeri MJ11]|uniref:Uncharacterized protein n=1 Tax=Aliivibrio fischeri (strain MJ11) TaxID=388396 RepID=B5EW29_ALIFM|nr:hypothetical protein [Aliivibrio fischeri]ACH64659.1 hypothetical protein VFMJ11_B0086 [Aliivibrio fischeri MJ11]
MSNTTSSTSVYAVTLLIRLGDYEKHISKFIEADSEEDANYTALVNETHNEIMSREDYDNCAEWWDDYMIYSVYSCNKLSDDAYEFLKKNSILLG